MKKYASLLLIPSVILAVSSSPALADEDTVKSVLGGMLGSIIVEGVKELNNQEQEQQQQQQEQIQWQEPERVEPIRQNPVRQPALSEADPKEIAHIKEVQGLLGKSGFYKGTTDGINGGATETAIRAWETELEQTVDGKISDDELVLLKDFANGGFSNKELYDAAKAVGAKNEYAYLNRKSEEVHTFLKDAEAFLKDYSGDVDLKVITADLKTLQDTKRGKWKDDFQEPYFRLQKFFASLNGFESFRQTQKTQRDKDENVRKAKLLSEIKDFQEFSDDFLKQNMNDENGIRLSEALQGMELEKAGGLTEEKLQELHKAIEKKLGYEDLFDELQSWKLKKYPPPEVPTEDNKPADGASADTSSEKKSQGFWGMWQSTADQNTEAKAENTTKAVNGLVQSEKFEIKIFSVRIMKTVGEGSMFASEASSGASYVVVNYSVKNISTKPISSWYFPSVYLLDENGNRYKQDVGASASYATESDSSSKAFSDLNPGISMTDHAVFEVSDQLFDRSKWLIEIDADEEFKLPVNQF